MPEIAAVAGSRLLAGARVEAARLADLLWIALAIGLVVGTGLFVRSPWPADEPRFALIARDMVHTGEWLFPRIGGDLYGDKPPVYFWLLAVGYLITGSLRTSFLIPSFLSAMTVAVLVYDIGRRMAGRASGLAAALTLSCCIQFAMTMRGAQIDPVLCAFTTLSLYAFLRHLLFGPAWGWYFVGGLFAGLGVVTKGVGFLPLLVLPLYAGLRALRFDVPHAASLRMSGGGIATTSDASGPQRTGGWRWALVVPAFLLGVSVWLLPMLVAVATRNDPALVAYRDEILFEQTVARYASAWHHVKPWYYFIADVIPGLWLPMSLLLFWLVPTWANAWRDRDIRAWLPLGWALLVLLFFSLSTGKRGVYILPALPAVAMAAAPWLPKLFRRRGVQRASMVLGGILLTGGIALFMAAVAGHDKLTAELARQGVGSYAPLGVFAAIGLFAWAAAVRKDPVLAWPSVFACVALVWSYGITPQIDGERSARDFMRQALSGVPRRTSVGLVQYKEQFLLNVDRSVITFGHARWREGPQEAYDAAAWLNEAPDRVLLVPSELLSPCFSGASRRLAGRSSRQDWYLVRDGASATCAAKGNASRAMRYRPPVLSGT